MIGDLFLSSKTTTVVQTKFGTRYFDVTLPTRNPGRSWAQKQNNNYPLNPNLKTRRYGPNTYPLEPLKYCKSAKSNSNHLPAGAKRGWHNRASEIQIQLNRNTMFPVVSIRKQKRNGSLIYE